MELPSVLPGTHLGARLEGAKRHRARALVEAELAGEPDGGLRLRGGGEQQQGQYQQGW